MAYETASDIIGAACEAELGLTAIDDPYSSTSEEQIQLRALLNQCGRELYAMKEGGWEQFIRSETIDTGSQPEVDNPDGRYDLPDDFGAFINQTGWSPTSAGAGLPLGGPLTEIQYTAIVATGLGPSTIYIQFLINEGQLQFLPIPLPENIDITYKYLSNAWVQVGGDPSNRASKAENADDVIMFEPVLISTLLALRYKQAKGLESTALLQKFQHLYSVFSGVNRPAGVLSLVNGSGFPYLSDRNIPVTGFGS